MSHPSTPPTVARARRQPWPILTVSHLLCLTLLLQPAWPLLLAVEPPPEERDPFRGRAGIKVGSGGHGAVKQVTPEKLKATKEIFTKWAKPNAAGVPTTQGPVPIEVMKAMYQAGGFETVKTLIENKVISSDHSMQMADHRIIMMFETFQGIVKSYAEKGRKLRIHRSDSGNQKAGMSSDVDQTILVEEFKDGRWMRVEHMDTEIKERFAEQFELDHKLSAEALDIATISGKDKPPDFRTSDAELASEGKRPFKLHASETLFELERNPGAYQETGPVVQQVQERIARGLKETLRANPDAPALPVPRESLVSEKFKGFNLNQLLFLTIGYGENPNDGEVAVREGFQEDARRAMFDGLDPKLIRGHAYDSAVANYLEFQHHLDDKNPAVKYHLRALDDALYTLYRLDQGEKGKVEYGDRSLTPDQRAERLANLIGKNLGNQDFGRNFVDRWRMAFDISAEMRQLHSDKKLNDATARKAFEPLMKELAESDKRNKRPAKTPDEYHALAREQYHQRCQEFFMYNIIATAQDRVAEWLSGDDDPAKHEPFEKALDEPALRKQLGLEGPEHDAKWQARKQEFRSHFSFIAELQLLNTFRKLKDRPDLLHLILERAARVETPEGKKRLSPDDLARLRVLVFRSSGIFLGRMTWQEMPRMYIDRALFLFKREYVRPPSEYAKSMKNYLLVESGWKDTPDGPRLTDLVKMGGTKVIHEFFAEITGKNKMAAFTDRVLGRTFLNIGTVQALSQTLIAYSESGGDWEETRAAMGRELLLLLPIAGLVKSSYDAGTDVKGQLMLVIAIKFPVAGIAMAAFAIGEAGLTLYGYEVSTPLKNQLSDALYRGYVGPTLYDFSKEGAPPFFTNDDVDSLAAVESEIEDLTGVVESDEGNIETGRALARASRRRYELLEKKTAWETWEKNDRKYEGGAITGVGTEEIQRPVDLPGPEDAELFQGQPMATVGSILHGVKPLIFYAPGDHGPIDFTVVDLTAEEKKKLDDFMASIDKPQDPLAFVEKKAQAERWLLQQDAFQRKQDYLKRAATNRELMHQIKRDSLWPHILQDRDSIVGMASAEEYIRRWIAVRGQPLQAALEKQGVTGRVVDTAHIEELKERLIKDTDRSRRLFEIMTVFQKAREKAFAEKMEREKAAFAAEALMDATEKLDRLLPPETAAFLRELGLDAKGAQAAIGAAIRERNVPESAPVVTISIRKVPVENRAPEENLLAKPATPAASPASGPPPEPKWEFRPDVKVRANADIYRAPYFFVTYVLDPKSAKEAAASRRYLGLPLQEDSVKTLEAYVKTVPPPTPGTDPQKARFTPMALTFVFCSDVQIPKRVVPETVEKLPRLESYNIVYPKNAEPGPAKGFLLASAVGGVPIETVPEGKLTISTKPGGYGWITSGAKQVHIAVTSEALGQADKRKPPAGEVAARREGVVFKVQWAPSPTGPWTPIGPDWMAFPNGGNSDQGTILAPNKRMIGIQIDQEYANGKIPYQPVYLRVAQQGGRWNFANRKPDLEGPIEYSDVSDPGEPTIWLPIDRRENVKEEERNLMLMDQYNSTAEPCLQLSNHGYRCQGAKYKVTYGDMTAYMFDVADIYGKERDYLVQNKILLPSILSGGLMSIEAEDPQGRKATRQVKVVMPPAVVQQGEERIAKLIAESKVEKPHEVKNLEDAKAKLKLMESAPPPDPTKVSQDFILQRQIDRARQHFYVAEYEYRAGPQTRIRRELDAAKVSGQGRRILELATQLEALEIKLDKADITLCETIIPLVDERINLAVQAGKAPAEKSLRTERTNLVSRLNQAKYRLRTEKMEAAVLAGAPDVYRAASDEYLKTVKARSAAGLIPDWQSVWAAFERNGWMMVQVTGEPALGIQLLKEGWSIRKKGAPQLFQQDYVAWLKKLRPAWFPIDTRID